MDVDDTAKGLLTLSLLGQEDRVNPDPMFRMFEAKDHFLTFLGERDPSFTSNCHVLLALLQRSDRLQHIIQVRKAADFIVNTWWECDGKVKDKWVRSTFGHQRILAN